jgi:hypothetical protein
MAFYNDSAGSLLRLFYRELKPCGYEQWAEPITVAGGIYS